MGVHAPPSSESHPAVATEALGWDASLVSSRSNRKLRWRCKLGHEWDAIVFSRTRPPGNGCPFCGNRKVLAGFNDLASTHPQIGAQAVGWDPATVIAGSGRKRRWRCELGHEWDASPAARVKGAGCLVCLNRQVLAGFNDLSTTHPELAAQACGWDPTTIVSGNKGRRTWRCEVGHEWNAQVRSALGATWAVRDAPIAPMPSVTRSLAENHPQIAAQAFGWGRGYGNVGEQRDTSVAVF